MTWSTALAARARSFLGGHCSPTTIHASAVPHGAEAAIQVRILSDAITAPGSVPAGRVVIEVSTDRPVSGVGLARLTSGATTEDLRAGLVGVTAADPGSVRAGAERLQGIDLLGGVLVRNGAQATFDQHLEEGHYELFDYTDITTASRPTRGALTVGPPCARSRTNPPDITLTSIDADVGPRFVVDGKLRASEPVRVINKLAAQPSEAVFFPAFSDTSESRLAGWFGQFHGSAPPPKPPIDLTAGIGSMPLSSRLDSTVMAPGRPGRYVIASMLNDFAEGRRMAGKGQYLVVEVLPSHSR